MALHFSSSSPHSALQIPYSCNCRKVLTAMWSCFDACWLRCCENEYILCSVVSFDLGCAAPFACINFLLAWPTVDQSDRWIEWFVERSNKRPFSFKGFDWFGVHSGCDQFRRGLPSNVELIQRHAFVESRGKNDLVTSHTFFHFLKRPRLIVHS